MAKFKIGVQSTLNYTYEVEAESEDQAEREALDMAKDGKDIIWYELQDVDITNTEEVTE